MGEIPVLNEESSRPSSINMKIGREGSIFIVAMGFVAFLNGSIGTWFSLGFYVFGFFAVLAIIGKLISKVSSGDAKAVGQIKDALKGVKPNHVNNLSLGNVKEVEKVWKDLPQHHFNDKESAFNQAINAGNAPRNFAVAHKALYETRRKRGSFQQPRVTRDDIMRPLASDEVSEYENFSAQAQKNLIELHS